MTSRADAHEIVTVADALGDVLHDRRALAELRALALEIFGAGDRAPGWLLRKLQREGVDPQRSSLLRERATGRALGYMLISPSRLADNMSYGSGMGLTPSARGRGLGRRLVLATAARLRGAGFTRLELPAEDRLRPFYGSLGFRAGACHETWLTYPRAPKPGRELSSWLRAPAEPWTPDDDDGTRRVELAGWREDTWIHTPPPRTSIRLAAAVAHLSREGRALLIHRVLLPQPVEHHLRPTLLALREHGALGTPILLYGVKPVSFITHELQSTGWIVAQRSHLMTLTLDDHERHPP